MEENLKMQQGELDIPGSCDVNLSDFAIFLSVMKVKEAYQCTLSIALDEADLELEEVKVEQVILNMTSKNGRPELVSLLQYMRGTRMNNPEVKVKDERIVRLDEIVQEVKQSEEWEAVKMNLLEIGEARGEARGEEKKLIRQVARNSVKERLRM